MKIVAGIDNGLQGERLLQVLQDLDFPDVQLKLVNVIEVWADAGAAQYGIEVPPYNMEVYFNRLQRDARSVLDQIQESATKRGLGECQSQILYGHITNQAMDYADAEHAQ